MRTVSQITGYEGVITFGVDGPRRERSRRRKIDHLGSDGPTVWRRSASGEPLGTAVPANVRPVPGVRATIRDVNRFIDVDLDSPRLPAQIIGTIDGGHGDEDVVVAVGCNGDIVAVTRSYVDEDGRRGFHALIPLAALRDGRNEIDLLLVEGAGVGRRLQRLEQ